MAENNVNIGVNVDTSELEKLEQKLQDVRLAMTQWDETTEQGKAYIDDYTKQEKKLVEQIDKLKNSQQEQVEVQASTDTSTRGLATTFGKAVLATKSLKAGFQALKATLMSNPIGLLVTAITTAFSALYTLWNNNKQKEQEEADRLDNLKTSVDNLRESLYKLSSGEIGNKIIELQNTLSSFGLNITSEADIADALNIFGGEDNDDISRRIHQYKTEFIDFFNSWESQTENAGKGAIEFYKTTKLNLEALQQMYTIGKDVAKQESKNSNNTKKSTDNTKNKTNAVKDLTQAYEDEIEILNALKDAEFQRYGYTKQYFEYEEQIYSTKVAEQEALRQYYSSSYDLQESERKAGEKAVEQNLKLLELHKKLSDELTLYKAQQSALARILELSAEENITETNTATNIKELYILWGDLNDNIDEAGDNVADVIASFDEYFTDENGNKRLKSLGDLIGEFNDLNSTIAEHPEDRNRLITLSDEIIRVSDVVKQSSSSISNSFDASSDALSRFSEEVILFSNYGFITNEFGEQLKSSSIAIDAIISDLVSPGEGVFEKIMGENDFSETEIELIRPMLNGLRDLGTDGIKLAIEYKKNIDNIYATTESGVLEGVTKNKQQIVEDYELFSNAGLIALGEYYDKKRTYQWYDYTNQVQNINDIAQKMKEFGIQEVEIEEWKNEQKENLRKKYNANIKLLNRQQLTDEIGVAQSITDNITTIFSDGFEGNKQVQIATTIASTIANAAMTFGTVFSSPSTKGGVSSRAIQAGIASAAVVASGIKAVNQLKDVKKNTSSLSSSSTSGISSSSTDSNVQNTLITRKYDSANSNRIETVVVVDEITAKQKQQNTAKVISRV